MDASVGGGSWGTQNLGNKIGTRRSTHVAQAPGGSSSISLGSDEPPPASRQPEVVARNNPINWGELQAAPRSSPAVARAGADDRMKNSPFATAEPTKEAQTAARGYAQNPGPRPTTPYATAENNENMPPATRSGRKITGNAPQEKGATMLTWKPASVAEKAAEAQIVAESRDRVSGGGRMSVSLGTNDAPRVQPSGRVPPGGVSSFNLSHA